jgi:hypothetical protein
MNVSSENASTEAHCKGLGELLEAVIHAMNECNQEAHNCRFRLEVKSVWLLGRRIPGQSELVDA